MQSDTKSTLPPSSSQRFFNYISCYFQRVWQQYLRFVADTILARCPNSREDISYWREKLFTCFVSYGLPISLLTVIPGIWIGLEEGYKLVVFFGIVIIGTVSLVACNKHLSLLFRKAFIIVMFYLLAIMLTIIFGSFGPGILYLLALNLFITLTFSTRAAYWSVAVNVLLGGVFALVIEYKLFNTPLAYEYHTGTWIAVISNLIFLSWVGVALVNYLLNGLENTLTKEYLLQDELQQETLERRKRNEQLRESEGHYKSLFHLNPSPMWVFDDESLLFLQVNEAAVKNYGFTQKEFMSMTIKDIRPQEDLSNFLNTFKRNLATGQAFRTICRHQRKNRQSFHVEVQCSTIPFNGRIAKLAIARDITDQINHIQAIESQNKKLQEISFIQSHIVRAPLARIMGLVDLLIKHTAEKPDKEILNHLENSAKEFDEVIKTITHKAQESKTISPDIIR